MSTSSLFTGSAFSGRRAGVVGGRERARVFQPFRAWVVVAAGELPVFVVGRFTGQNVPQQAHCWLAVAPAEGGLARGLLTPEPAPACVWWRAANAAVWFAAWQALGGPAFPAIRAAAGPLADYWVCSG